MEAPFWNREGGHILIECIILVGLYFEMYALLKFQSGGVVFMKRGTVWVRRGCHILFKSIILVGFIFLYVGFIEIPVRVGSFHETMHSLRMERVATFCLSPSYWLNLYSYM